MNRLGISIICIRPWCSWFWKIRNLGKLWPKSGENTHISFATLLLTRINKEKKTFYNALFPTDTIRNLVQENPIPAHIRWLNPKPCSITSIRTSLVFPSILPTYYPAYYHVHTCPLTSPMFHFSDYLMKGSNRRLCYSLIIVISNPLWVTYVWITIQTYSSRSHSDPTKSYLHYILQVTLNVHSSHNIDSSLFYCIVIFVSTFYYFL